MRGAVVFLAMGEEGHFQRLRPVIAAVARRGARAHVLTDARFAGAVRQAGAAFGDLFAGRALDDDSLPVPSRFVTFAAAHAESVAAEVAALGASLIVCDTFTVIGRVVARRLELPFVNVCAGHNLDPARVLAELAVDPRVRTSDRCRRAVDELRARHGVEDASPFSYVAGASPWLNLYCEPPHYLAPEERRPFEPIAFFGSLPDAVLPASRAAPSGDAPRKIYVSFGTVIWRYYAAVARAALEAIVAAAPGDAQLLISLGRAPVDAAGLVRDRVRVRDYVDQWAALREADVVVTHHGLNSTHEAIACGVPMVSYPFFWDQPSLAARCQALGLAVPLVRGVRAPISPDDVTAALAGVTRRAPALRERLAEARRWELETIAGRDAVADRMLGLAR